MTSRTASRRQAPGKTRARELSDGHQKDGGGSIEGGQWPGHEEQPNFELEKRSSAVGSGGCGTIQRGPFLMARSLLSRAWAVASRTGILWGSRTWWVEGKGGEGRGAGQGTVTRSQRTRPRNGRLQGWTTGAQHACVRLHEQAMWVHTQHLCHSRSAQMSLRLALDVVSSPTWPRDGTRLANTPAAGATTPQRGRPCPKGVGDGVRYTMYCTQGLVSQGHVFRLNLCRKTGINVIMDPAYNKNLI